MSHKATTWAVSLRGLTAGEFRVLVILADCHNPAMGCFPSQAYLMEAAELSNGGLNANLARLEEKGLIRRERRGNKEGGRASTRYILAFEGELSPECGDKVNSTQPELRGGLSPLFEGVVSSGVETEPVKEPVKKKTPSNSDFDAFWEECPRKVAKGDARTAFKKAMKKADADTIISAMNRHAKAMAGKEAKYIPHPATWLNGERWEDDPPQLTAIQGGADDRVAYYNSFGRKA